MNTFAIAILNWNGKNFLKKFLESVTKFSDDATVYLIDNHSSDNSLIFVEEHYPMVKIIKHDVNYGFAEGYNKALEHIEEEVICFLNSDVEVTPNWLQHITPYFENEKNVIVQPKILDYNKKNHFEYAGAAGGFIDFFGYPYCRGRVFDTIEEDNYQYASSKIFWASGACFFIKKSTFELLGGFDKDYFAHQEEIDLCWRAYNYGIDVYCESNSIVFHAGGGTLSHQNPKKTFLNFRNSLYSISKNTPIQYTFFIIICRLFLDGLAGIRFIINMEFAHCWAIVRAHFSFYVNFLKTYKKRQQNTKTSYFHQFSILFNYFLRQKKVF